MNSSNDYGIEQLHPRYTANCLSRLTFFYTLNIFKKIYKKAIKEDGLHQIPDSFKSQKLGQELERIINSDIKIHNNLSLYRVLWKFIGIKYLFIGIMQLIARSISVITIPFYVGKLVSYFVPAQTRITKQEAIIHASLVIGLNIFNYFYLHNYLLLISALSIKVRAAFCSVIYRKSLKLSPASLLKTPPGKITTLIQKDVRTVQEMVRLANDVWIGLVQALIVCACVYWKIGVAAVVGCGTFLAILPLQILIGKKASSYRTQIGRSSDERLQLTKEIFAAIEIIKMYTWEIIFGRKVEEARRKELQSITKLFTVKVVLLLLGAMTSKIAFFFLFVTYLWTGNYVAAESIYFILSAFQKLRQSFTVIIPRGISQAAELTSSLKRIQDLLISEETASIEKKNSFSNQPKIRIENTNVTGDVLLRHTVEISEPSLIILTGPNGSGKTTLLNVILGNISLPNKKVLTYGSVSYAPQEPWVFPSTIRQNILFGEVLDLVRYEKVLTVCSLRQDIDRFPEHDRTLIGDKGLNLSKGQRARISLARAIYRSSDIYLLDDCLASLDARVQNEIFRNCIKNFLGDKICIFASYSSKYINFANRVFQINELGELKETEHLKYLEDIKYDATLENVAEETIQSNIANISDSGEEVPLLDKKLEKKGNVYAEVHKSGRVNAKYYGQYIAYGGRLLFGIVVILFGATQLLKSYTDKVISVWVTVEQNKSLTRPTRNKTQIANYDEAHDSMSIQFSILISLTTALSVLTALGFFSFTTKSSKTIHAKMLSSLLRAKMAFFENTHLGNVLNRFSKDLTVIDEEYPFVVYEFIELLMTTCGIIVLITLTQPLLLIPEIVLFLLLCIIRHFYLPTGRNFQRLDSANVTVGDIGLAITQSMMLTGLFQYGVRMWADLENKMTSTERALEYTEIDTEDFKGQILNEWPKLGKIQYDNVSVLNHSGEAILRNVSFDIKPGEKIGIIGRTGAGKTTLVSALYRLKDIEGTVLIDDVDIKELNIKFLRKNIGIIPQDPVLFTGTVRYNIDPKGLFPDSELWEILHKLELATSLKSLDQFVAENGSNLSYGEKQLLCLCRILLNAYKILVLDEATSSTGGNTDKIISGIITNKFEKSTVLIIAHKLETILKLDRVMVIDNGEVIEFDKPEILMNNSNSLFYTMVKSSGIS
ncbi:multidrug resistance-associated protein 4-like isoform X2 [Sitophilus oryzae]|uniref:Multidrug resistance-associated protein 4-like isoform X2 n=1 Tax=Sitophilus oryzae TaxID=7048 RepID=A0A6J2XG21_SITOR|nr:multidrug resistance-associated protein 4-like isoform X2 [Sitophilus oryzae]